jgi:hypothetical protein
MKDNGKEPANSTDISPLLVGANGQAERDRTTVAFSNFEKTHPDSFAAEFATLSLATARSAQDAARRNEEAAKVVHEAAGRVETAVPDPGKLMGLLERLPTQGHVSQVIAQGQNLAAKWDQLAHDVRSQVNKFGHKATRPILFCSLKVGAGILIGALGMQLYTQQQTERAVAAANAQAHEREKAFLASMPYATRLEVLLERHGGRMESQAGRLVIHPGRDTIKNAYRDPATGDAVIVYQ